MGKEEKKTERGAVPMFVSTRNVIGLCAACSAFVATVTGHLLRGQRTGPRRPRHDLISDSTRHPGGPWSTPSTRTLAFSSLPWLSAGGSERKPHLGTRTVTNALPAPARLQAGGGPASVSPVRSSRAARGEPLLSLCAASSCCRRLESRL